MKEDSKMTPFEETAMTILNSICQRLEKIENSVEYLKQCELDMDERLGDVDVYSSDEIGEIAWDHDGVDKLLIELFGEDKIQAWKTDALDKRSTQENIIKFPKT
tara:strand:+ start:278 stop:589 length:312 start_codon:yes stop_codon:yes gene_type:complete